MYSIGLLDQRVSKVVRKLEEVIHVLQSRGRHSYNNLLISGPSRSFFSRIRGTLEVSVGVAETLSLGVMGMLFLSLWTASISSDPMTSMRLNLQE